MAWRTTILAKVWNCNLFVLNFCVLSLEFLFNHVSFHRIFYLVTVCDVQKFTHKVILGD
jgi:hypothetical protein